MKQLMELPPHSSHAALAACVKAYNAVPDTRERRLEKIFLLQKISYLLDTTPTDLELSTWRKLSGAKSLEANLQRYGILRDGSTLVKNVLFAEAVYQVLSPADDIPNIDYFTALQKRNELLANAELSPETLTMYAQYNQVILNAFKNSTELQEKYDRSQYFLSLCYSKLEAIQGVVDQNFSEFETHTLGAESLNNQNFTLNVEGEEKALVIRVEDRNSMANEQILQTYPVSQYFSEEYFAIMMPFQEGYTINYRPLVLSEYIEKGGLDNYAESLSEYSSVDIGNETERIFTLLTDFCLKLIESGHYHPDIKLSNFLTDGKSIKVSDRKTIVNQVNPLISDIQSTPPYAPPEYRACLNSMGTRLNYAQAYRTRVDMPKFMSYQLGMALKEFLLSAKPYEGMTEELFMQWAHSSLFSSHFKLKISNLFVLIQELTRANPNDRLSIQNFKFLLTQTQLSPKAFLKQLEEISPREHLSHAKELTFAQSILETPSPTAEQLSDWDALIQSELANEIFNDPRTDFLAIAKKEILAYLYKINTLLEQESLKSSSPVTVLQTYFGIPSPQKTRIEDLPAIPIMSPKIQRYFELFEQIPSQYLSDEDRAKLRHIYARQTGQLKFAPLVDELPGSDLNSGFTTPEDRASPDAEINTVSRSSSSDQYEIDSGTFRRKEPSTASDNPALDSGTMIRKPEAGPKHQTVSEFKKKIMESFDKKEQTPDPKAADIPSTVKRGNKG